MKNRYLEAITLVSGLLVTSASLAHDPLEHQGKMEKPRCEALEEMDRSKMDATDPVVMAMMKKCMKNHPGNEHHGDSHPHEVHHGDAHHGEPHHGEAHHGEPHHGEPHHGENRDEGTE